MSHVFRFHGGVHPPENKRQSTRSAIRQAPLPSQLILPLSQHIGVPAEPLVKPGDRVLKGQCIAEAVGHISAALHAPTSGIVTEIGPRPVPHASGLEASCIVIDADGEDRWIEHAGLDDYRTLSKTALIDYIRASGITGMGGAGFPTDVKLHLGDHHIVNTLIINAAECEPYITADDMQIRERADDIVAGIKIIAHLLKPSHILIGIEDNKPKAVRALEKALTGCALNLDLRVVPTRYPSGGEKQLIKLLTDVEVPSGRIPADVGIVCQNTGTAYAIARAVHQGEPLISRIVTVTGEAVAQPQNFDTLIGTPYQLLLQAARVNPGQMYRLVVGGPMMGYTVDNDQIPVIKTTNCLIAASPEEMPEPPPAQECIRCGLCEQVCPAELLPQQLYWFAKGRELDKAKHHNLFDCIECGACSYVCSSFIPLVQYYRNAKAEIRNDEAEQLKAEHARQRFEARQARLEAEQAEKEARRKARAEEAARNQAARKDMASPRATSAPATSSTTQAQPADDAPLDLKQLKTAASVARTKLRQAQKGLRNTEDKGLDGAEALRITVSELNTRAEAAQHAYDQAQNASSASPAPPDIKQLKTNAAVARTKLKQAEKALASARENSSDESVALEVQLRELNIRATDAQKALEAAESGMVGGSAAKRSEITALKADMDAARIKADKAQTALDAAIASGSPAVDKMNAGVEKLQARYQDAKAAWQAADTTDNAATVDNTAASATDRAPETAGSANAAPVTPDIKTLKQQVSIMRTKLKKAEKSLQDPAASNSAQHQADVDDLQARLESAQAELAAAEQSRMDAAAATGIDLKQLQVEAALARAEVTKAERALNKATPDTATEALEQALQQARTRADDLNQTLSRFE